ncbi:hypothetical protein B0H12DRAFT_1069892 [Mycena haematopus]|nr:hypothetical protein B0H12DRAFT_1069892 [Mycena haematopus]
MDHVVEWMVIASTLTAEGGLTAAEDTKIESRMLIPSTLTAEGGLTAAEDTKIESQNGWSAHRDSPLKVGSQRLRTVGENNFRICSGILKTAKIESRMVIPLTLTAEGGLTAAEDTKIESRVLIAWTLTAEGGLTAAADSGRNQFSNLQRKIEKTEN